MKKNIFCFTILLTIVVANTLFAQNEANIWYFGNKAGIDFNSGTALPLTDGKMRVNEGCATISDNTGKLLFYTSGDTIWDSSHNLMPNGSGLLGDQTSSQTSVIVKKPGSNTIYYVFTLLPPSLEKLSYSEVDMTLNGGLGDVTSNKNIFITNGVSEKLTAVQHSNGVDFWIVTTIADSDAFHAYLLSSSGLNLTPTISNVGPPILSGGYTGYLKASLDGSRLAMACSFQNYLGLFDFDNSTGVVSNEMSVTVPSPAGPYGVEFSPSGNILYVSFWVTDYICQYNLQAGSQAAIDASRINLATKLYAGGALQLAPDGKIYHAISGLTITAIGVINHPDMLGLGCNYNANGFALGNGTFSHYGLPNFYNSIVTSPLSSEFSFLNICLGDPTFFKIKSTVFLDSVRWDFGDPVTGVNNVSVDTNPVHLFSDTGTFNVKLISYFNHFSDTVINEIRIKPLPTIFLGNDTVLCKGEEFILNASVLGVNNYLWQDNSNDSIFSINEEGAYWVEVELDGCKSSDTLSVGMVPTLSLDMGNDTVFCEGEGLVLDASALGVNSYLWQDNSNDSTFSVGEEGTYWVVVTNDCEEVVSDTIVVLSELCNCALYVPTSFTPNLDGLNDTFKAEYSCDFISFNITIFNRWGEKLFETNNIENGWTGTFKNENVPEGVYICKINYSEDDGINVKKVSKVVLLR